MARISMIIPVCLILFASCANGRATRVFPEYAASGNSAMPHKRVHFPTAGTRIESRELSVLSETAAWLGENPGVVLVLEGHCDERGSDEFNMELGDRRARSVAAALADKGIESERVSTVVSHGERSPIDAAHNKRAWRKNRRVEFIVR